MKDDKQINLQTPYEIKSPTYTKKNLNINITDTGKGNNRRWQATDGQREQRANSAGRFRHGSPRKYTSRVNPSTSLQNAVKNKVYRLHRKTPECQHYRYRQGQQPALASHRRTARNERIPPDGFDMAALENCCPQSSLRGDVADFHEESSKSIDKTVKMDYNCKGSPTKNRFSASLP